MTVRISSSPPVHSMPLESAIFQRKSDLRQLRIIARGRALARCLRPETASAPRSCTAWRTAKMSGGSWSGLPNQIETLRGQPVGHFQKNRPPRKLKMLPHSSSR